MEKSMSLTLNIKASFIRLNNVVNSFMQEFWLIKTNRHQ